MPPNWKKFEFPIEDGMNKLQWRYKKDSSTFAGLDAAFIDNVFLPDMPNVEPEPDTKLSLAAVDIMAEGIKLILSGGVSKSYDIQFSTDLKSWNTVANVSISETGNVEFIDNTSREIFAKETWVEASGFYRAISSPQPDGD